MSEYRVSEVVRFHVERCVWVSGKQRGWVRDWFPLRQKRQGLVELRRARKERPGTAFRLVRVTQTTDEVLS